MIITYLICRYVIFNKKQKISFTEAVDLLKGKVKSLIQPALN
jgi:hypothetical protein